jgi:hypothetical protein
MNKIGFVIPGQRPEKSKRRAQQPVPASLDNLRRKIAQFMLYICSTEFARMRKKDKMEKLLEYNQMCMLEIEYAAAVSGGGVREVASVANDGFAETMEWGGGPPAFWTEVWKVTRVLGSGEVIGTVDVPDYGEYDIEDMR